MRYDLNMATTLIPIVAAALTSFIIGVIWYNKYIFGGIWERYLNRTPELAAKARRSMPVVAVLGILSQMLIAYVMQDVIFALNTYNLVGAFVDGLWCWVGFVLPILLVSVLWEQKPFGYFLIHAFYWLIAFTSMGMVLFYVGQIFALPYSS